MRCTFGLALTLLFSTQLFAETNSCYQAAIEYRDKDVLTECEGLADEGDPHAAYLWALATINLETRFGNSSDTNADERALRLFKLPIEEKQAIQDAKVYLRQAVNSGHVDAHFLLGYVMLETSFSLPEFNGNMNKHSQRAEQLLNIAAENGNKGAIMTLAEFAVSRNQNGQVVNIHPKYFGYLQTASVDSPEFFKQLLQEYQLFSESANEIHTDSSGVDPELVANEGIRLTYSNSKAEFDKGVELLTDAAKRGSHNANYRLARLTVKQNLEQAIEFFLAAAPKHKDAAMWLGEHYGCKKNKSLALKWLGTAQKLGRNDAIDAIEEIEEYGDLANCPS